MGSLFSPSTPAYSPVSYSPPVRTISTPAPVASISSPSTVTNTDSKTDEDIAKDIIKRTTRGRNSTIQTSYRGVLDPISNGTIAPQRKSLLGE